MMMMMDKYCKSIFLFFSSVFCLYYPIRLWLLQFNALVRVGLHVMRRKLQRCQKKYLYLSRYSLWRHCTNIAPPSYYVDCCYQRGKVLYAEKEISHMSLDSTESLRTYLQGHFD